MRVTANGKTFNLPDGLSQDQIGEVIDDYFSNQAPAQQAVPEQQATAPTPALAAPAALANPLVDQQTGYVAKQEPMATAPANWPAGMPNYVPAYNAGVAQRNEYEKSFIGHPELQKIKQEEAERGVLSAMGKGIAHSAKDIYYGLSNIANKYIPSAITNALWAYPEGATPEQRMANNDKVMAEENARFRIVSGEHPGSTTIGQMLPEFGTGEILGRVARVGIGAIAPKLGKAAINAVEKVAPAEASHLRNVPRIASDFGARAQEAALSPLIGAVQGGAHYNYTAGEGALMGIGGALSGLIGPAKVLSRVENVRDAAGKDLIKEMHVKGFKLTPGVITGNRAMQTEEAALRNSDTFGDFAYQTIDRPNQRKMTEMAGDAIGLDGKGRDMFSQSELDAHLRSLSKEYQDLERASTGHIQSGEWEDLGNIASDLRGRGSLAADIYDALREQSSVRLPSTSNGNLLPPPPGQTVNHAIVYNGNHFEPIMNRINAELSTAVNQGDTVAAKKIGEMKDILDKSIKRGMSPENAAKHKDLNERYAMTHMLIENGLTPQGKVDPSGLTNKVMSDAEAKRTLTGRGGRIKNFQNIARYNSVLKDVEGSGLSGGIEDGGSRSLTKLPFTYRLPLAGRIKAGYRLSRLPTVGFGPTVPIRVARAFSMTNPYEKASNQVSDWADQIRSYFGGGNAD